MWAPFVAIGLGGVPACDRSERCATPPAAQPATEDGVAASRSFLYGAASEPRLVDLDERERNGVVALSRPGSDVPSCTGALIGPALVLTAAHCIEGGVLEVRIGAEASDPEWAIDSDDVLVHDNLDLALLYLPLAVPDDLATPLRPAVEPSNMIGQRVQLAGFGLTESDDPGRRLFADEVVVDDDGALITVDGAGESGACLGDSGGPLLIRDAAGTLRTLGVLSRGSANCLHLDQYVLLHAARPWLEYASASAPCTEHGAPPR